MKKLRQTLCDYLKLLSLLSFATGLWAIASILANMI